MKVFGPSLVFAISIGAISPVHAHADTLNIVFGHSICDGIGPDDNPPLAPGSYRRGRLFEAGLTVPTSYVQVRNLLALAKGFFERKLTHSSTEMVYMLMACVPGFQFAPLWAYPGHGVGTWHPDGPNFPAVREHLYQVLRRNRNISDINVYFLNGFNDAVFAILSGVNNIDQLGKSFVTIHQAVTKTAREAGLEGPVRMGVEMPLSQYAEPIQLWVDIMIEIALQLEKSYDAKAIGVGNLEFSDPIHPTRLSVKKIGAAFADQARKWELGR